jgi:acyl-coenzyme A synthetase/AMP-(fatty) acid ligase
MFESVIIRQAKSKGRSVAYSTPGRDIAFAVMDRHIRSTFARLKGFGVKRGERVALRLSNTYLHWLLTFAIEAHGAVSILVDRHWPMDRKVLNFLRADVLITDEDCAPIDGVRIHRLDPQWLPTTFKFRAPPLPQIKRSDDDLIRIVLTSGTTGTLKKVPLTRGVIDRRIEDVLAEQLMATENTRVLPMIGERSIGGFMTGLSAWSLGAAVYSRDYAVNWADAVASLKINCIVAAPVHLKDLLKELPEDFRPVEDLVLYSIGRRPGKGFGGGGAPAAHLAHRHQLWHHRERRHHSGGPGPLGRRGGLCRVCRPLHRP